MHKTRRYIIVVLFFIFIGMMIYGMFLSNSEHIDDIAKSHRFKGMAVTGLFLVVMPLFIFHRWKDKKVKDYMLTEENIMKMKAFNDSKES
jgi:hypothetical protein